VAAWSGLRVCLCVTGDGIFSSVSLATVGPWMMDGVLRGMLSCLNHIFFSHLRYRSFLAPPPTKQHCLSLCVWCVCGRACVGAVESSLRLLVPS